MAKREQAMALLHAGSRMNGEILYSQRISLVVRSKAVPIPATCIERSVPVSMEPLCLPTNTLSVTMSAGP